jgi:hypothetical protein
LLFADSGYGEMAESAEGARLLSEYTGKPVSRVRIPLSPPVFVYRVPALMEEMVRLSASILFCAVICGAIALAGCSKKEEKNAGVPTATPSGQMAKKETSVHVPESVKGKWKAVKIGVIDKRTNKESVYDVAIGSEFKVPNSNLTIKIESFLPHFTMEGTTLTSLTNEPKNPAAQIRITENGKEVFKGWLFSLYPTTHAFQHTVYGFSLVDFIPAT